MANFLRIVHAHKSAVVSSILIDKIDRSQGNFSGYANRAKQKIYVPYFNPNDPSVSGYLDLVPTDEVLLSVDSGTIGKLVTAGYLTGPVAVSSASVSAPTTSGAVLATNVITVSGTKFTSTAPDRTYVIVENLTGHTLTIPQSAFNSISASSIAFSDALTTSLGTIGSGWKVTVKANSKTSNVATLA